MTYIDAMMEAERLEKLSLDTLTERQNYWLSLVAWDKKAIDVCIELSRTKQRDEWKTLYDKRNQLKQRYNEAESRAAYQQRYLEKIQLNP